MDDCKGHSGNHRILVKAGRNEWRYYGLTATQLRFWNGLTKAEKGLLARMQEDGCLVCALARMIERKKRFGDQLYSSMMRSLLTSGGGS